MVLRFKLKLWYPDADFLDFLLSVQAERLDLIQFIQPIISHIKLLNILKLPFHTDNDDDDDDTLVYCMEALLVTCSRAADIDNFWKYNGKY